MNGIATSRSGARGQTSVDFAVGVSVFLLTVAFVVAFVPQMSAPYEDQEHPLVGERVTSTLTDDLLAEQGQPAVLNTTCTIAFLTEDGSPPTYCPDTNEPVQDLVGIESYYQMNITLERNVTGDSEREILCDTGSSVGPCTSGADSLARGPPVPTDKRSVATSRRTVRVDGTVAIIQVSVW